MEFTFSMQILKTVGQRTVRVTTDEAKEILTKATSCKVVVMEEQYTHNTFDVTVTAYNITIETIKNRITQYFKDNKEYTGWFL